MLTYQGLGDTFMGFLNALVYAFAFSTLIFVLFILYMTIITIKVNEKNTESARKRKLFKNNYRSLLYSIPLLVMIFLSFLKNL